MAKQKYILKFKQWFLKKIKEISSSIWDIAKKVIDTIGLPLIILIVLLAVWGIFIEKESVILVLVASLIWLSILFLLFKIVKTIVEVIVKVTAKTADLLVKYLKYLIGITFVLSKILNGAPVDGEKISEQLSNQTAILQEIKNRPSSTEVYVPALPNSNEQPETQTEVLSAIKTQTSSIKEYVSALPDLTEQLETQTEVLSAIKTQTSSIKEYVSALPDLTEQLETQAEVLSAIKTQTSSIKEYVSALSELTEQLETHLKNGHEHMTNNHGHTIGELIHRHKRLISEDSILLQNDGINTKAVSILEEAANKSICRDGNYFMTAAHKVFHGGIVVPGEDKLQGCSFEECYKDTCMLLKNMESKECRKSLTPGECLKLLKSNNASKNASETNDDCRPKPQKCPE